MLTQPNITRVIVPLIAVRLLKCNIVSASQSKRIGDIKKDILLIFCSLLNMLKKIHIYSIIMKLTVGWFSLECRRIIIEETSSITCI
jgi:hypothetical protein